jgi:hypothetical protein
MPNVTGDSAYRVLAAPNLSRDNPATLPSWQQIDNLLPFLL